MSDVYNPLDKINLARSIELELLGRPPMPLSDVEGIKGAGVYVIYYTGDFPAYLANAAIDPNEPAALPIYIGKAIPRGGRKGGVSVKTAAAGVALRDRLRQHATS
ncbi:MAG: Eco29kI family restriction endonuclease, partial [Caulobacter sp.]